MERVRPPLCKCSALRLALRPSWKRNEDETCFDKNDPPLPLRPRLQHDATACLRPERPLAISRFIEFMFSPSRPRLSVVPRCDLFAPEEPRGWELVPRGTTRRLRFLPRLWLTRFLFAPLSRAVLWCPFRASARVWSML